MGDLSPMSGPELPMLSQASYFRSLIASGFIMAAWEMLKPFADRGWQIEDVEPIDHIALRQSNHVQG